MYWLVPGEYTLRRVEVDLENTNSQKTEKQLLDTQKENHTGTERGDCFNGRGAAKNVEWQREVKKYKN